MRNENQLYDLPAWLSSLRIGENDNSFASAVGSLLISLDGVLKGVVEPPTEINCKSIEPS